ncbi:hypothetical protein G7054_g12822 [Neopestalotiopsis clavispora]|nr:hypothetical protein G7054_g12822 [Neopestalotiopsis clavispora]
MLLRPMFLTKTPSTLARKNLEAAAGLASETIGILSCLDETTDIYGKQHPYYNHLLNSSCALLMLVAAHAEQYQKSLARPLRNRFTNSVGCSFQKAYRLATAYKTSSRASCTSWKRLNVMKEPLYHLEIVSAEFYYDGCCQATPKTLIRNARANEEEIVNTSDQPNALQPLLSTNYNAVAGSLAQGRSRPGDLEVEAADSIGTNSYDLNVEGYTGPILGDWPFGEANTFLSEGWL